MKAGLGTESLLGAALAGRATRSDAPSRREPDAGFAGLLGGALQQQGGRAGRDTVYEGSAFDVPEAKPSEAASRGGSQADIERRQIDQRQQRARSEAQREAAPAERGQDDVPKAAESRQPSAANKPRAPDAPRESGRASREGKAVAEAVATESAPAEASGGARDAQAAPAEGEPAAATAPTTQEWMARWATLSGSDAAAGAGGAGDGEGTLPTAALQRLAGAAGAATAGAAAAQASGQPAGSTGEASPAATANLAVALPADTRAEASTPGAATARVDAPGAVLPGHVAAPAAASATTAPAQAAASVPVPLEAPDFSQALGWQLATLARDGVHEAQLQLNPVEMGPVQVQILLDGGQAQIDFTAAHARTREVLEAGWPALAAAMHSAGFTLGGGGVFEQRTPERDAQREGEGARMRDGEAGEAPALVGVTRPAGANPRGLLDLYA